MSNGRTTINWDIQPEKFRRLSVKELVRRTGLAESTVRRRLRQGISLDIPRMASNQLVSAYSELKPEGMADLTWSEIGAKYGLSEGAAQQRAEAGIPLELSKDEAKREGRRKFLETMAGRTDDTRKWSDDRPEITRSAMAVCRQMRDWQKATAAAL